MALSVARPLIRYTKFELMSCSKYHFGSPFPTVPISLHNPNKECIPTSQGGGYGWLLTPNQATIVELCRAGEAKVVEWCRKALEATRQRAKQVNLTNSAKKVMVVVRDKEGLARRVVTSAIQRNVVIQEWRMLHSSKETSTGGVSPAEGVEGVKVPTKEKKTSWARLQKHLPGWQAALSHQASRIQATISKRLTQTK